ncbi:MAG: hypothetical protein ACFE8U_05620 [Candidatus Hermodarchaeota archaeon]
MLERTDKNGNFVVENNLVTAYLEPIPTNSFLRVRLLRLFTQAGLPDLEAQILLSIILHGGKMKTTSLARDLDITRHRLLSGLPTLESFGLTLISHHRPKTIMLAIPLSDIIQRLALRKLGFQHRGNPQDAQDILHRIHMKSVKLSPEKNHIRTLINYFQNLRDLRTHIKSIFHLTDFAFSSLFLQSNESLILALLIEQGGYVTKRRFYKEKIKPFKEKEIQMDLSMIIKDLNYLGYSKEEQEKIAAQIKSFYKQGRDRVTISGEKDFNMILNGLRPFCQTVFSGSTREHEYKKENLPKATISLVLVKSLDEISDYLYKPIKEYYSIHKEDIQHLNYANKYVKFIDPEIFQSTLNSYDSFIKRLDRELSYVKYVRMSIFNDKYLEFILPRIFDSENEKFRLEFIVNEEMQAQFINLIKNELRSESSARGILPDDSLAFIPVFEMPDGNIIIMTYEAESSSLTYFEEISNNRPATFTTLDSDVESDLDQFHEIFTKNQKKVVHLGNYVIK